MFDCQYIPTALHHAKNRWFRRNTVRSLWNIARVIPVIVISGMIAHPVMNRGNFLPVNHFGMNNSIHYIIDLGKRNIISFLELSQLASLDYSGLLLNKCSIRIISKKAQ